MMPSAADETEDHSPTIPELFSPLRRSFQTADFDRVEQALISRESNLKRRLAVLREAADLENLEVLRLADELNALKKKKEQVVVSDEGKEVIWQLRNENRRLETERSFLERECEALESRVVVLEDDTVRLINVMCGDHHIHNGGGGRVDLDPLFDSLIAAHNNGTLQIPAREAKLNRVIEKQREEFAELVKEHKFEMQKMHKIENELKVCKANLDELKEERKVLEEKHQNECEALERKHQSHLLEVENELKHCKAELVALKEEKNISDEKYEKLRQEVNKHRKDEDEVVNVKEEKDISNEKYEKLLEKVNKHRNDEDEVFSFGSQKNKVLKSRPKYLELENEISRIDKFMSELKHLGLKNMDKRSKINTMTDGSRKQKSIPDPNLAMNMEDLCDSVPANASSRGNGGVGNSGISKSSSEAPILLSDSDDDCAPRETTYFGLKRKRASSPIGSDDNNCGHKFEKESFPTAENKQSRMLRQCGSRISTIGKQNNPSSCDEENLRPLEEKVGEKQKSEDASFTKVNFESDSSSSFSFSSDDSKEDDDINLESLMLFKTNRP